MRLPGSHPLATVNPWVPQPGLLPLVMSWRTCGLEYYYQDQQNRTQQLLNIVSGTHQRRVDKADSLLPYSNPLLIDSI